mmetsp:Transcript_5307/g.10494  ORF Transcript_5307/g.10494 Transcript_5307/m.10494 type:complete len:107 (-) Transcript_5307:222-542(-)|eukprot:scaffold375_cov157-Amphora_coffeaeformis.AAC.7
MEADVAAANKEAVATSQADQDDSCFVLFSLLLAAAEDKHRLGVVTNSGVVVVVAAVHDTAAVGRCREEGEETVANARLERQALPSKLIVRIGGSVKQQRYRHLCDD